VLLLLLLLLLLMVVVGEELRVGIVVFQIAAVGRGHVDDVAVTCGGGGVVKGVGRGVVDKMVEKWLVGVVLLLVVVVVVVGRGGEVIVVLLHLGSSGGVAR
jgi:hypothetical protein